MALLEVSGLRVGYGTLPVLYGIDFSIEEGETAVVLGLNGAGKTTTVLTLAGVLTPWEGTIRYNGEDVTKTPVEQMVARGVTLVPEGRRVFPNLPVEDNLRVGAWVKRHDTDFVEAQLERCFTYFPRLRERREQIAGTLSGGEQQMLAMARALCLEPKAMLLDEPTEGLMPAMIAKIRDSVRELKSQNVATILVEQRVDAVLPVADRVAFIETGRLRAVLDVAALRDDPSLLHRYVGVGD